MPTGISLESAANIPIQSRSSQPGPPRLSTLLFPFLLCNDTENVQTEEMRMHHVGRLVKRRSTCGTRDVHGWFAAHKFVGWPTLAFPLCSTPFSVRSARSQCCDPTESQSRGAKITSSRCSIVVFVCFLSLVKLIARIEMAQDCATSTARDWFCPQWQTHKWHWTKKAKPRKLL